MGAPEKSGPGMSLIIGLAKKKVQDSLPKAASTSESDGETVAEDILAAIAESDPAALSKALLAFRDVTASDSDD